MKTADAKALIRDAVTAGTEGPGRAWADLGAGSGTFTFALAELLGPDGEVVALDREEAAVASLRRGLEARTDREEARVVPLLGDFQDPEAVAELGERAFDGILFANALHFDPDPARTLRRVGKLLAPGGRVAVVEYEDRPPNPWVPYPLPTARLREVAAELGAEAPTVVGERPSSYGGVLYCAWLRL